MITIKTGAYNAENILFLYNVLLNGLQKNCWQINEKETDISICKECRYRLACFEARSAANHMLSLYYQTQKVDSEK